MTDSTITLKPAHTTGGRWLYRLVRRVRGWWLHRKVMAACDRARREVGAMTREQKTALWESAINRIYPEGWWVCDTCRAVCALNNPCVVCGATHSPNVKLND